MTAIAMTPQQIASMERFQQSLLSSGFTKPMAGQTPPYRPPGVGLPPQNRLGQTPQNQVNGIQAEGFDPGQIQRMQRIQRDAELQERLGNHEKIFQQVVAGGYNTAPQQGSNQPQQMQSLQTGQQFGLGGAEQALQAGALGGINAIGAGQRNAMNTLQGGFGQAANFINRGVSALGGGGSFGGGGGGFGGGGGASAQRAAAASLNENTGQGQFREGIQGVQQFQGAGQQAQQRQLALSGALGQEAFDQARINDPAQAFLREQGEQSIINQRAATGGLGGGQIGKELARFGQGLASQNLQQERDAVNQLSSQGLQAAGQAGQLLGQAGSLQGQLAGQQANMINQTNMQNAQLGTQASISNANNANQAGIAAGRNATALRQAQAQLFGQGAGLAGQFAGQGAGFQMGAGRNVADILGGAGRSTADYRFNAGRDIANRIGTTTGGMSDLQNQQGRNYSDVIGSGGLNLSNLYTGAGGIAGMGQAELARLLANVNMRQGTQAGNDAYNQGQINSQAYLNQGNNYVSTMGDLLKLYNSQKQDGGLSLAQQAQLDIDNSIDGGGL